MERRKGIERMRGGPEQSCTNGFSFKDGGYILAFNGDSSSGVQVPSGDISDSSSWLLELAADNDLEGFRQAVEEGKANVDVVGSWYSRHNATTQMVLEQRTPAMIAALYGSLDVLMYIGNSYAASGRDIDETCGTDGNTALHCAAAGGSVLAVETVKLLLDSGAKLDVLDAQGRRPADVIRVSPRLAHLKVALENMLNGMKPLPICSVDVPAGWNSTVSPVADDDRLLSSFSSTSGFVVSRAIDAGVVEPFVDFSSLSSLSTLPGSSSLSRSSSSLLSSSPRSPSTTAASTFGEGPEKGKEEYPIDTCIPDINNSIYMTDEFRMFSFKVRPCSRAYSHDWTECPFVHPGENARRRDPRRYHYSCVPCPDFRKGSCRLGDACEYAHGVFESWLHPAQYRTRLCKDGTGCVRRVCFFAHTTEELRPLYVSTDSAGLPSRTTACLDMAAVNQPLTPSSPLVLMRSPFSPSNPAPNLAQGSHPTPPMSPSSPSLNSGTWSQPSVPPLHLPGASLHASRLRAALNARDMTIEELTRPSELDEQLMNELTCVSSQALCTQARLNAAVAASAGGSTSSRAGKYKNLGPSVAPTNLEELFASEIMSSPRSVVHDSVLLPQMEAQMLSHKYTHLHSQPQNQLQAQITSQAFPQVSAQSQLHLQQAALSSQSRGSSLSSSPVLISSLNLGTLGRMSALGWMDAEGQGKQGVNGPSVAAARIAFAQCDKRSHSSRDLGAGLALSDWGSPTGKPEWGVQGDDLLKFRKSASFGFRGSEEPYLLWAQKLKEGTLDADVSSAATDWSGDSSGSGQTESIDHYSVLGSWIDKMQLDQIVA